MNERAEELAKPGTAGGIQVARAILDGIQRQYEGAKTEPYSVENRYQLSLSKSREGLMLEVLQGLGENVSSEEVVEAYVEAAGHLEQVIDDSDAETIDRVRASLTLAVMIGNLAESARAEAFQDTAHRLFRSTVSLREELGGVEKQQATALEATEAMLGVAVSKHLDDDPDSTLEVTERVIAIATKYEGKEAEIGLPLEDLEFVREKNRVAAARLGLPVDERIAQLDALRQRIAD